MRKYRVICGLAVFLLFVCSTCIMARANNVVVVLDPGHGGGNLGGEYEEYTEKNMTIVTAHSMKEELEKYEGITVYMTRESDKDMSLEERVNYAESVGADFLFCLHYNMSVHHNLFGAEVWVSAFEEPYQKGSTFAGIEMDMLTELGLYSRGIKTKFNDRGEDYYGIIRHATAIGMPAVIIEHCHLDQENDKKFYNNIEKWKQFGILDATAVAKYYGLKSEILGVDYTDYEKEKIPLPSSPVKPDKTPPDVCEIEAGEADKTTGLVGITLSAQDYDSGMLYYSYSFDGGITYSDLQRWEPAGMDTIHFQITIPSGIIPEIVVNAYNAFDGITESNHIMLPSMTYGEEESKKTDGGISSAAKNAETEEYYKDISPDEGKEKETKKDNTMNSAWYFLQISIVCVGILLVLCILVYLLLSASGGSKKKRRRRK